MFLASGTPSGEGSDLSSPAPQRQRRPQRRPAVVEGWLIRRLARLLALLPLAFAHRLGDALLWLSFPITRQRRRVMAANLAAAFPAMPDTERQALLRESYRQSLYLVLETGLLWHGSQHRWEGLLERDSEWEALQQALATARTRRCGTLLLVPHFGNWELLCLLLGQFRMTALYDPPKLMSLEDTIRQARERAGATLLPINRCGLRGVLRALGDGGVVAVLPDQVPAAKAGLYAPFFDRPTLTMTLASRLVEKTQPQVLMLGLAREGDRFRLYQEALPGDVLAEASAIDCLTQINAATERLILRAPAQYQWAYKRYKRPPPGVEKLY